MVAGSSRWLSSMPGGCARFAPFPEGRGALGAVAWGGTAMSWHRGRRWRSCLVVSPAVVWRCGWVMRLLGSQRGSAAAWGFRGLFLCLALPIVRVLVRCSGDSYAAAPRTPLVLARGIRTRLRHGLLRCWSPWRSRGLAGGPPRADGMRGVRACRCRCRCFEVCSRAQMWLP